MPRLRDYRLSRIVGQLRKRDLARLLTFDPLNIRYITDSTNMQLWTTHNPARACFVSAEVYFGEVGGPRGIELEDQVLITEDGYENLTRYPFDHRFLT